MMIRYTHTHSEMITTLKLINVSFPHVVATFWYVMRVLESTFFFSFSFNNIFLLC